MEGVYHWNIDDGAEPGEELSEAQVTQLRGLFNEALGDGGRHSGLQGNGIPFWCRILALPSSWIGFLAICLGTVLLHLPWQGWCAGAFLIGSLTQLKLFASYGLAVRAIVDPLGLGGSRTLQRRALKGAVFNGLAAVTLYAWAFRLV